MRSSSERLDVVVVGAGHNGLTAAALLARAGLRVAVVERREVPGGAAATEELVPGFRFSTCAYACHLLHERVARELGLEAHGLRLRPSPEPVHVLPDGRVASDPEPEATVRWNAFWDQAARAVDPFLLEDAPPPEAFGPLAEQSVNGLLRETFATAEARAVHAPAYVDGDPELPGSALAYALVETDRLRDPAFQGVPAGGMGTVAAAFARAAEAAGAELLLGREVAEVVAGEGVVLADGSRLRAPAVVSNADPLRTAALAGLPPPARPAGFGAAKLHFALREPPDVSAFADDPQELGVVFLLRALDWYERVFPDAAAGRLPEASYVELQLPSFADATLAPPGAHAASAYVPYVAVGLDRDALADLVVRRIQAAVPNFRRALVEAVVLLPEDLERRVALSGGLIHHLPHAPGAVLGQRPGPRLAPGLYLCGAGAHPGGEISGVPGWNCARAVLADLERPP